MGVLLRRGRAADAAALGQICYDAFKAIAAAHNFPPDFPSPEVAAGVLGSYLAREGFFDLVAEVDGHIVGSNFLDERNPISGLGPITVAPALQNEGAGRALMQAALERAQERRVKGVRLVQAGYHSRSLALYLKLGFEVREQLACIQGSALRKTIAGRSVRRATKLDLAACNSLCLRVHGHERGGELADAITQGIARVAENGGRITGYTTCMAYFGHAVAESNEDVKALIADAEVFLGPGFLVPTRNTDLMRWCLGENLRIVQTMTLMTMGFYREPDGVWLPSVIY